MSNSQLKLSASRLRKQQLVTTDTELSTIVNAAHVLAQGSAQADLKFPVGGERRRMAESCLQDKCTCYVTVGTFGIQEGEGDVHK